MMLLMVMVMVIEIVPCALISQYCTDPQLRWGHWINHGLMREYVHFDAMISVHQFLHGLAGVMIHERLKLVDEQVHDLVIEPLVVLALALTTA